MSQLNPAYLVITIMHTDTKTNHIIPACLHVQGNDTTFFGRPEPSPDTPTDLIRKTYEQGNLAGYQSELPEQRESEDYL